MQIFEWWPHMHSATTAQSRAAPRRALPLAAGTSLFGRFRRAGLDVRVVTEDVTGVPHVLELNQPRVFLGPVRPLDEGLVVGSDIVVVQVRLGAAQRAQPRYQRVLYESYPCRIVFFASVT